MCHCLLQTLLLSRDAPLEDSLLDSRVKIQGVGMLHKEFALPSCPGACSFSLSSSTAVGNGNASFGSSSACMQKLNEKVSVRTAWLLLQTLKVLVIEQTSWNLGDFKAKGRKFLIQLEGVKISNLIPSLIPSERWMSGEKFIKLCKN